MSDKDRVGGKRKMGRLLEAVDQLKELVIQRVLHDQLSNLRSIMGRNPFFAALFALTLAPVAATAQTPALDSGASAHIDFTIAQKQTVYQSISKTQKNNAAPVGFRPAVGVIVPNGVELAPVPNAIAELMPQTKGLETALVEGEVILVDPQGKKVIAVITPQP